MFKVKKIRFYTKIKRLSISEYILSLHCYLGGKIVVNIIKVTEKEICVSRKRQ